MSEFVYLIGTRKKFKVGFFVGTLMELMFLLHRDNIHKIITVTDGYRRWIDLMTYFNTYYTLSNNNTWFKGNAYNINKYVLDLCNLMKYPRIHLHIQKAIADLQD